MTSGQKFPRLSSTFRVRGRTLRNRIVSTSHATGWSHSGLIDQREMDYHIRKAQGGVGLVMTFGSACVDPSTQASYGSIALWDERNETNLRALAEGVHAHGALIMSQMTHMGRRGHSVTSGIPLRAPSDLPEGSHLEIPVPLDAAEIPDIVQRFADAARRLEACGWDGAEITSFGGHLIEQFFDPMVNTRTDEYGGSLENRTRFGREVLEAVRAAVSDSFIVAFRMASDQCLTGGLGPDDMIEIARSLASTGAIDLFSLSGGTGATKLATAYFVPPDELPEGVYNERAAQFRQAVGVPVLVAGRNVEPEMAEAAVESGIDLVAMTRAIIADPDLPLKVLHEGGRKRPCIGLNEGCIGRLYSGLPMWCSVNPAIREPGLAHLTPADRPGRIVVVGGGVAGLEAARAASLRGHQVVVFEGRPEVGGRARLAAERRGRERWLDYIAWLQAEVQDAGVDLRCAVTATTDLVLAHQPDAVILATGSRVRPVTQPAGVPIITVDQLLEHGVPESGSGTALIVDDEGGFLAPTAAEALAGSGMTVEILTSHSDAGIMIDPTQRPFVLRRMGQAGISVTPHLEWLPGGGAEIAFRHMYTEEVQTRAGVGLLVIAGRLQARVDLRASLLAASPRLAITVVGDALAPRTLLDAVAEGAKAGATIEAGLIGETTAEDAKTPVYAEQPY